MTGEFSSAVVVMNIIPNNLSRQSSIKSAWFAFISPCIPLVFSCHVISRTQSHIVVFGRCPSAWTERHQLTTSFDSWAISVLVGLHGDRVGGVDLCKKTNFRFGNIVPKQWILSGFVQHTSVKSMYKNTRPVSNYKCCISMKCFNVTHFQTSFSVGIQLVWLIAKSPRKHIEYTTLHRLIV